MEDIIRALLDVVRAQHTAAEGSEEKPFDLDDIIDMALNISGRPDEPEEEKELAESIQKMAEEMAPDIFPPKTFEEMDDSERAASAVNMIEERLRQGGTRTEPAAGRGNAAGAFSMSGSTAADQSSAFVSDSGSSSATDQNSSFADYGTSSAFSDYGEASAPSDYGNGVFSGLNGSDVDLQEAANLNDIIYNNFMQMMGLSEPKVEYPFDRSQIRYGREKSATEMLEEEEREKRAAEQEEQQRRPVSAWELAQAAIDKDEEAHQKEEPAAKEFKMPETKSASQLAAEAIARAQEEDKMKMEAEKRAERLMEEARKRGKDPMAFALHQQEILNYMEKNSDELVSFEDYEDLSPEEKLEIEKQLFREKQIEAGVAPEDIPDELPDEVLEEAGIDLPEKSAGPSASGQEAAAAAGQNESSSDNAGAAGSQPTAPVFSDEMLRQISAEVVGENEEMILAEDPNADLDGINEAIFTNLKQLMESTGGAPVTQEDLESLIGEVVARNTQPESTEASGETAPAAQNVQNAQTVPNVQPVQPVQPAETRQPEEVREAQPQEPVFTQTEPMSAVELARAAQAAARPEPKEVKEGKSAVELAREAQENAKKAAAPKEEADPDELNEEDLNFDEIDLFDEDTASPQEDSVQAAPVQETSVQEPTAPEQNTVSEEPAAPDEPTAPESKADPEDGSAEGKQPAAKETAGEEESAESPEPVTVSVGESKADDSQEDDYEYVDPDELVLGEHTQAEVDEAIENLASLGLEGEVYERAKRMLLLELAGSEAALDAWLYEQENGKKKRAAVSALDKEEDADDLTDLEDLNEDDLEKELELAMDEDFDLEESAEEEEKSESGEEESEEEPESEEAEPEAEPKPESEAAAKEESLVKSGVEEPAETPEPESTAEDAQEPEEETRGNGGLNEETNEEEVQVEKTRPERKERKAGITSGRPAQERPVYSRGHRNIVKRKEKHVAKEESKPAPRMVPAGIKAEKKEFQVSVNHPFALKNSANYMDRFEEFIVDTQENRKLSTGFKRLDAMLRYGLHKGSYFIDANPQYLKNGFMQQMADRAAESGVDVLYISTELSRYDLMVESISRLSYEISGKDESKAVSAMAIMTGEDGASLASLKDELNWYRGRISEHLFILDQEAVEEYVESMENASAGEILEALIRSMVQEGVHKPAVFIDNIENILSAEDSEDMEPLMEGIRKLAGELGIPILLSYGYAQAESDSELYPEEGEFHASLGNMCDVYIELKYADMITEDYQELTPEDIAEMAEDGELLLVDILLHRNIKSRKASCQIQAAPKFNYFEE